MLDQSPNAELLARIPADPKFPVEEITKTTTYFSPLQKAWVIAYGAQFSCFELCQLMGKSREATRAMAKRLGVQLPDGRGGPGQPKPTLRRNFTTTVVRRVTHKVPAPDPAKAHERQVFALCGISPQVGQQYRQERIVYPESRLPESVRRYKPAQPDLDAGWFLNNWILHKMGLKKLGPEGCSYIAGDPSQAGWSFCGKKRTRGSVYCEGHRADTLDHTKQPQQKEPQDG